MPNPSDPNPQIIKERLRRTRQISESHCGPAVLQMLLDYVGVSVSQQRLASAIGAETFIEQRGMRIDELAKAVHLTSPDVQFWYKTESTIEELEAIVSQFGYPVGIEWQSLFYETPEEEAEDTQGESYDFGHYSVVRYVNTTDDEIVIADPYMEFADRDRYFSIQWFEERWWDTNELQEDGTIRWVRDDRAMFIIVPKGLYFPKLLGLRPLS
jgi:hypothetical protein